jgi:hypothetical protein
MKLLKSQCVYVIHNPEFNITKIGVSDNPSKRMGDLEIACGCDLNLCYHTDPLLNAPIYENLVHKAIKDKQKKGEWFFITPEEAVNTINSVIKDAETDPIVVKYKNRIPISTIAKDLDVSRQAIIARLRVLGFHDKDIDDVRIDTIHSESPEILKTNTALSRKEKILHHTMSIDTEIPPKGTTGFKRIGENLYFNGEWYQMSFYKDGKFDHSYTKDIDKARNLIKTHKA